MRKKGLCMDPATFQGCPDAIPVQWPSTEGDQVGSIRLYTPWDPAWGSDYHRSKAWSALIAWVKAHDVKVLLGTEVTCDDAADAERWFWTMELMKMLGKEHVMGIAIGNELDTFATQRGEANAACNAKLWNGHLWETLRHHVHDMDLNGFTDTKVTVVWSLRMLGSPGDAARPFKEDESATASTLVKLAAKKWPTRWVWTFNMYSFYDDAWRPSSAQDCASRTAEAVGIEPIRRTLREIRRRIQLVTGRSDDILWVGENGWSSDGAPSFLDNVLSFCPQFASPGAQSAAYKTFLEWDLSLGGGVKGVDHAFYYTVRDDPHRGSHFGLIPSCSNSTCKVQPPSSQGLVATFT